MGITEIDHVLAVLGLSTDMNEEQRIYTASQIMKGMEDKMNEAGGRIAGGQTVKNPWVMTGGSVMGIIDGYLINNKNSHEDCSIILTKPIGSQMIINFKQYFRTNEKFKNEILSTKLLTEEKFEEIYQQGIKQMSTLNLYSALIMREFGNDIKACTDITGFGLLGHAENLVQIQEKNVDFLIDNIPMYGNLYQLDKLVRNFKIKEGLSAETSGGLMIVLENSIKKQFIEKLKKKYDIDSWEIGRVVKGNKKAVISQETKFLEIW